MSGDVTARIRAVCATDPRSVAIAEGGRTMSYGRLRRELDGVVGTLRTAGVSPGDVVEVRARRVGLLPVALLAVWDVGATAAIVDAAHPEPHLRDCAAVARPQWRLAFGDREPVTVAGTGLPRDGSTADHPDEPASHILFTSGTTGRPAAVAVGRGALRRTFEWYLRTFAPDTADRVALLAGVGHDPMLRDAFVPLMSGGTLVVPPGDVFAHPDRLLSCLRRARVTILHATPALLELVLAADPAFGRGVLESVRLVISAGAPLPMGTVRRLRSATGAVVVNGYGATETPQLASCEFVPADDDGLPDDATAGVGSGVDGAELVIAAAGGRIDGATRGEIVVRSRNLARGYLPGCGRPDRFLPDPRGVPGYRAYRTGDLGERGAGGGIRILGRIDRQLSVNGFRVQPEEIERAAMRHSLVAAAAAGVLPASTGDLVDLSVVPVRTGAVDARALRAFLRSMLPEYAVPSRIRVVAGLPLDANHKVRFR